MKLLLLLALALMVLSANAQFDMDTIMSKLPMAMPFVGKYIKEEECKIRLGKVARDAAALYKGYKKSQEKPTVPEMSKVMCQLGPVCSEELAEGFVELTQGVKLIETIVEKQMGGVKIAEMPEKVKMLYAVLCMNEEDDEEMEELLSKAGRVDEDADLDDDMSDEL